MAAQITHIVLADKIFDKFFVNRERSNFFIGTCFPDIRYLKVIERGKTHLSDMNILPTDSDFLAGVKFHAIVDAVQKKCIAESKIHSLSQASEQTQRALKLLEDALLYGSLPNWSDYIHFFDKILPEEVAFGVSEESLKKWHVILQTYFAKQPTKITTRQFILSLGLTIEAADEIDKVMLKLSANKKIIHILNNLYENFEIIINETGKYIT